MSSSNGTISKFVGSASAKILAVGVLLAGAVAVPVVTGGGGSGWDGTTCSSVTQYGITWTFNKAVPCGTYANGDSWVSPASGDSTVTINSMTPTFASGRNGAEVNPVGNHDFNSDTQGYDNRLDGYVAGNDPSLPYAASPGASIIKTISRTRTGCAFSSGIDQHAPCLDTAAVLTVVSTPADLTGHFRPPYAGSSKPDFTTAQLQTSLLPSLASVTGAPTLANEERRYQRVQMDDTSNGASGRYQHPTLNYTTDDNAVACPSEGGETRLCTSAYGAEIARDNGDALLRLYLNDSLSSKMPLLIDVVQAGIDYYGMQLANVTWGGNGGGHFIGRKAVGVFAAVMLNDATFKSNISNDATTPNFTSGANWGNEDVATYYSSTTGGGTLALWGRINDGCDTGVYDDVLASASGPSDCRDPDEYIDGGYNGPVDYGRYMECCWVDPVQSNALAMRLLPGAMTVWNHNAFFDFEDRWISTGYHTLPDDRGTARYASLNGTWGSSSEPLHNRTAYDTAFSDNMWLAYR